MNAHKKLRELGFKRTQFHKAGYDPVSYETMMVLDNEETIHEYKFGKRTSTVIAKKHPKANSFWVLHYNEVFTLWALVKNHDLNMIWLENKNGKSSKSIYTRNPKSKGDERLSIIYDVSDRDSFKLEGKDQILNVLPTAVRRDFLLDQLFG
jgi:hypothetical protein